MRKKPFCIATAMTVLLAAGCSAATEPETTVSREPVNSTTNPFMEPIGTDQPNMTPPANVGGTVPAETAGLYGGTLDETSCDSVKMVAYLDQHPDKAAAWAGVLGISTAEIATYVASLTPTLLRSDTYVINHGFDKGQVTTIPAVLQAGTAVLVDAYGFPVTKCYCGNPLQRPTSYDRIVYTGPSWTSFSTTNVTIVQSSTVVINQFTLVDPAGTLAFDRPRATLGQQDSAPTVLPPAPSGAASLPVQVPPPSGAPSGPPPPSGTRPSGAPSGPPPSGAPPSGARPSGGLPPPGGPPPSGAPRSGAPSAAPPSAAPSGPPRSGAPPVPSGQPSAVPPSGGAPSVIPAPSGQPPSGQPPSGQPPSGGAPSVVPAPSGRSPSGAPSVVPAPSGQPPSGGVTPSGRSPSAGASSNASWVVGNCYADAAQTLNGTILVRNNDPAGQQTYQVTVTFGSSPGVTTSVPAVAAGKTAEADIESPATAGLSPNATVPCTITKIVDSSGRTPTQGPALPPPPDDRPSARTSPSSTAPTVPATPSRGPSVVPAPGAPSAPGAPGAPDQPIPAPS